MRIKYVVVGVLVAVAMFTCTATTSYATEDITDIIDSTVSGNESIPEEEMELDSEEEMELDPEEEMEWPTMSGNDVDYTEDFSELARILQEMYDFQVMSSYGGVNGTIPEPYLTYVKSCLSWSGIDDNYVAYVASYYYNNNTYYYYVIAIGDLTYNGVSFTGSGIDVYSFFPTVTGWSGSNFRHELQSSFSYAPGSYLCFTDLSSKYPDLRGQATKYIYVMLGILAAAVCFFTFTKIFGIGNAHFRRYPKKRG